MMNGRDLINWIQENKLEDAPVCVNVPGEYKMVWMAWESEYMDDSIMLEIANQDEIIQLQKDGAFNGCLQ